MGADAAARLGPLVALAAFGFSFIQARGVDGVATSPDRSATRSPPSPPIRLPRLADRIYLGHGFSAWGQGTPSGASTRSARRPSPSVTPGALWCTARQRHRAPAHFGWRCWADAHPPRYWWNRDWRPADPAAGHCCTGGTQRAMIGLGQKHRSANCWCLAPRGSARLA